MLHHHGGAGSSSPYLPPTAGAAPFAPPPTGPVSVASIPPPPMQPQPAGTSSGFAELPPDGGASSASLHDDDAPVDAGAGASGADASGSGGGGTRWPREETLALIRIRTEMDADFRNAPLKAPLWEDVARKLAALGYHRSAKKCKEKFENVDKYYRRTKEARAGRQDGRSYRFFSELEALHAAAAPQQPRHHHQQQQQQAAGMTAVQQADPQPLGTMAWRPPPPVPPSVAALGPPPGAGLPELSFSSGSGSGSDESESESDDDELGVEEEARRGKGEGSDGGWCDREMMALFEGMMKQVTEKQDAMQRVFLETLERWEAERTAREEAWRRQEVARMNREREQLARERAAAASRDAALIAFLQRVGGGQGPPVVRVPPPSAVAVAVASPVPPDRAPPSPRHDAPATSLQPLPAAAPPKPEEGWAWAGGESTGSTSSRWPKEEVQALIQLRTEKDEQYHDAGGKGPLWEDIAAGMRRIGYNRSAKRCKEKWENINKYFKKVKESNKRRPEDSKTCPYFHQLDAMYRKKRLAGRGGVGGAASAANMAAVTIAIAPTGQENPRQRELEGKSSNDVVDKGKQGSVHAPPGDGNTAPATTAPGDGGAKDKRAQDNVKETNAQLQQHQFAGDEMDSDDMGGDYTEDGNDEDRTQYKMSFQKPDVSSGSANAPAPAAAETAAAATGSASAAPTSSSFLAVQ